MLETSLETSLLSFKTAMVTIETVERERREKPHKTISMLLLRHFFQPFLCFTDSFKKSTRLVYNLALFNNKTNTK